MEIIEAPVIEAAMKKTRHATDEPCTAELAECTCPEFCERDHEQD